jgi:hypothetical protein
MTASQYYVGFLASVMILAPVFVWGQVGTATDSSSPAVTVPDVSVNTNVTVVPPAPVPQPTVGVEPVQPPIAVPRPAEVVIPSATSPAPTTSSEPIAPIHAMPLKIPTTQELLTKSIASEPGGSQQRLAAIAASPLSLSTTNDATPVVGAVTISSFSTNSPAAGQSSPWQKTNPLLNGVDYHW